MRKDRRKNPPSIKELGVTVRTLTFLAVIAVMIGGLVTWVALQPAPSRANASVTFLGYTNETSGARLARFAVTNLSAFAVVRTATYVIEMPSAKGWMPRSAGFLPWNRVLAVGASETITLPPPANDSPWKIGVGGPGAPEKIISLPPPANNSPWKLLIYVNPDAGAARGIKRVVASALVRVGVPVKYRTMTCQFSSDEVGNQNPK